MEVKVEIGKNIMVVTDDELNILQQALRQWRGYYGKYERSKLSEGDIRRQEESLAEADKMAEAVEAALWEIYLSEQAAIWEEQ